MDIKDILIKNLNISKLTGSSLREAIVLYFNHLPDAEKRRISSAIAHDVQPIEGKRK